MNLELRSLTSKDVDAFVLADAYAFGERHEDREKHEEWIHSDLDRAVAAFDGSELVGTGRNYSLDLTLPGGAIVPAAGVSWIATIPTHRRRGVLGAVMRYLLDDAAARDEPVAILTASEATTYERFGFGVATQVFGIRLLLAPIAFRDERPPGRLRFVEVDELSKIAPELFDRVRRARVGVVSRPKVWWVGEWAPPEPGNRFDVVYEVDGRVDGYVVYRTSGMWEEGFSRKRIEVRDLVAATPSAERALWQFLCEVDLVEEVRAVAVPIDSELAWQFTDSRQVRLSSLRDFLWLRPLDACRLLGARSYDAPGQLVLQVSDPMRPDGAASGRFLLEGGPDGASCERTDLPADLSLGVADLGSMALGTLAPQMLVRAGRVQEHVEGAAALAGRMFATDRAPTAFTWF